jgi:beta-lactamase class A
MTRTPTRRLTSLLIALALLFAGGTALAAPDARADSPTEITIPDSTAGEILTWVIEVLSGRSSEDVSGRFAPEFLELLPASLPEPRVVSAVRAAHETLFASGEARLLRLQTASNGAEITARVVAVETDQEFELYVAMDPERNLVTGMLITPASGIAEIPQSWEQIDATLTGMDGSLSVLVAKVGEGDALKDIYAIEPDRRLGIGSAFKLWVLGGLAELILEGGATWTEPLALDPSLKTMPIGALAIEANRHGINPTAEFPLSRYADVMISVSDNPATDHLIERVGRERIVDFMSRAHGMPELNMPFLSTGEFFKLKRGAPQAVLQAYIDAETPQQRQAVLDSEAYREAVISIPLAMRWQQDGPIAIDSVEWFASARELARTMLALRHLEAKEGMQPLARALRINDGIRLDDALWPSVAFKGGSEPGVLNLTYLADDADGETWFVSVGWNNSEAMLDEDAMIRVALGIFARLASDDMPEQPVTGE